MSAPQDESAKSTGADHRLNSSASSSDAGNDLPWTVLRLLEWTTQFFKTRGSESPRLDAEILLAHARQCSRIELYTAFADVPEEEQRVAFRELVRRRGEGMPVAQLVGYKEFYSLSFRVDENVLVPRPETEHLVIEALDRAKKIARDDRPLRIADIGTGSGAIAIALAKNLGNVEITAVDQSRAALKIAEWNIEQHQVAPIVTLVESDLFSELDPAVSFDIVCSNPPYVSEAEYEQLSPTVRDFEPREALVSGPSGTELIARLLRETTDRLVVGGRLIMELSPMIADACEKMVDESVSWQDLRFIKDLEGHRRILSVARSSDGS
jgi:release factor glutamine methyltransferase